MLWTISPAGRRRGWYRKPARRSRKPRRNCRGGRGRARATSSAPPSFNSPMVSPIRRAGCPSRSRKQAAAAPAPAAAPAQTGERHHHPGRRHAQAHRRAHGPQRAHRAARHHRLRGRPVGRAGPHGRQQGRLRPRRRHPDPHRLFRRRRRGRPSRQCPGQQPVGRRQDCAQARDQYRDGRGAGRRADRARHQACRREVAARAWRARSTTWPAAAGAKALKADEVQGGTFTITNHGVSGSLFATPIINQPQTAILGVGVMQKRVVVQRRTAAIPSPSGPMVYLTLTFDHRVLDGAVADRFMAS